MIDDMKKMAPANMSSAQVEAMADAAKKAANLFNSLFGG